MNWAQGLALLIWMLGDETTGVAKGLLMIAEIGRRIQGSVPKNRSDASGNGRSVRENSRRFAGDKLRTFSTRGIKAGGRKI